MKRYFRFRAISDETEKCKLTYVKYELDRGVVEVTDYGESDETWLSDSDDEELIVESGSIDWADVDLYENDVCFVIHPDFRTRIPMIMTRLGFITCLPQYGVVSYTYSNKDIEKIQLIGHINDLYELFDPIMFE